MLHFELETALSNSIYESQTFFQKLKEQYKTGRSLHQFGFKEQFTVMVFIRPAARCCNAICSACIKLSCPKVRGMRFLDPAKKPVLSCYSWGLQNASSLRIRMGNRAASVILHQFAVPEVKCLIKTIKNFFIVGYNQYRGVLLCGYFAKQIHHNASAF